MFRQKEVCNKLIDMEGFSTQKVFARTTKCDNLLGQGPGSEVCVVKRTIQAQEHFLASHLQHTAAHCRLKK